MKLGKVGVSAALKLEKLKVQLEELKAEGTQTDPTLEKKRANLEDLIARIEVAMQYTRKTVENDVINKVNERNRTRQLEIDAKRAELIRQRREEEEHKMDLDQGEI